MTLTVTGSLGGTGTHSADVTVTNAPPPTAAFTATPTYLSVQFNGTGSSVPVGTIASYAWDFGDGTTGTGSTAQHTYAAAGTYTVTLTVTGSLGGTGTHSANVTVADVPPPTAAFTATPTFLNVQFNGTGSTGWSARSCRMRGTSVTELPVPVRRRAIPTPRRGRTPSD